VIGLAKKKLNIPDFITAYIGTITPDGIEITEQNLPAAVNTYIGNAKRRLGKNATQARIFEDFKIEYLYNSLKSTSNLKSGLIDNITAPEKKAEEIRNTPINDELDDGYSPQEKEFVQRRLSEYESFYSLDGPNDKFGILDVIDIELRIQILKKQIREKMGRNKDTSDDDKILADLRKQWSALLKDLNLTKLQRDNPRNKKDETNSDTIADKLKEADKTVEDLEQEATAKKQEVAEMLRKRQSR
jgi:hypothetical protein